MHDGGYRDDMMLISHSAGKIALDGREGSRDGFCLISLFVVRCSLRVVGMLLS